MSRWSRLKAEVLAIPRGISAAARRGSMERKIGRKAASAAHARAANKPHGSTLGQPAARLTTREKNLWTGKMTTSVDLVGPRGRRVRKRKK